MSLLLDDILGWSIIVILLGTLSAGLVLPPLACLESVVSFGRYRRRIWGAGVLLGSIALWYALPPLVHLLYRHL